MLHLYFMCLLFNLYVFTVQNMLHGNMFGNRKTANT